VAKKMLTVEEVKRLALENYNRGGDVIIECWEDQQIADWISGEDERRFHDPANSEFVPVPRTRKDLKALFRLYRETRCD